MMARIRNGHVGTKEAERKEERQKGRVDRSLSHRFWEI